MTKVNKWGKPHYVKKRVEVPWKFYGWVDNGKQGFWLNPYNHQTRYGERSEIPPNPVIKYVLESTAPKADIKYKIPMRVRIKRGVDEKDKNSP